jgi:hypothetical protein
VSKSRPGLRSKVWVCALKAVEDFKEKHSTISGRQRLYWCGGRGEECAWHRKTQKATDWTEPLVVSEGYFRDRWYSFPINKAISAKSADGQSDFEGLMEDIVAFIDREGEENEQDLIFACQKGANRQVADALSQGLSPQLAPPAAPIYKMRAASDNDKS